MSAHSLSSLVLPACRSSLRYLSKKAFVRLSWRGDQVSRSPRFDAPRLAAGQPQSHDRSSSVPSTRSPTATTQSKTSSRPRANRAASHAASGDRCRRGANPVFDRSSGIGASSGMWPTGPPPPPPLVRACPTWWSRSAVPTRSATWKRTAASRRCIRRALAVQMLFLLLEERDPRDVALIDDLRRLDHRARPQHARSQATRGLVEYACAHALGDTVQARAAARAATAAIEAFPLPRHAAMVERYGIPIGSRSNIGPGIGRSPACPLTAVVESRPL